MMRDALERDAEAGIGLCEFARPEGDGHALPALNKLLHVPRCHDKRLKLFRCHWWQIAHSFLASLGQK